MKKIAVIGAGTMGNGIAHIFAQAGFSVSLIDVSQPQLDKALQTITKKFRQANCERKYWCRNKRCFAKKYCN